MEAIILYLLALILPIIATIMVKSTYSKYARVKNQNNYTGFDVAREILDKNGLKNVYIVENRSGGALSDCYDSSRKIVRLSHDVYYSGSVAAMAVAAHECGHAIQDKENYFWMRLRSSIFPIVSFGTRMAYILLIIGLIGGILDLIYISIALELLGLLFQIITLPVEFDASKRAEKLLWDYGIACDVEKGEIKSVLNSAAFTYIASMLSTLFDILYLLVRINDRR